MPAMNGRDLYQRLKALNPDLQCIFMSGYPSQILLSEDLSPHCAFIEKPFTLSDLIESLSDLLSP